MFHIHVIYFMFKIFSKYLTTTPFEKKEINSNYVSDITARVYFFSLRTEGVYIYIRVGGFQNFKVLGAAGYNTCGFICNLHHNS